MRSTRGVIWHDGEFQDWHAARTHVMNHTLNYGIGVIEGLRAYPGDRGSAIFRLRDHTRRLFESAQILGIDVPYGFDELMAAQRDAVAASGLDAAYVRVTLYCGVDALGLHADDGHPDSDDAQHPAAADYKDDWNQDATGGLRAHCFIAVWHMGPYFGARALQAGIRVRVSSYTRHHVNIMLCRAKATGNYLNSMLAYREATRDGYDEALMLDHTGFVMEGSGENVFLVRDGMLYTPALTAALDGITRRSIITLAREDGIEVIEKPITRDEVYIADEAFFTGTAAEVTPIREVDGRRIGNGARGPITERLQAHFFDAAHGRLDAHGDWLSPVH